MNVKLQLLTISLFLCIQSLLGQINTGGTPLSFDFNKNIYEKVPDVKMAKVNIEKLMLEDSINDLNKDIPWRFGENLFVDISPAKCGVTDILEDSSKLWRVEVESQNAVSLNLTFDKYKLPEGAKLWVYSSDKSEILGAFTNANNQEDGFFATTLIFSSKITIEYYEPANTEFSGELHLYRVTHGYRSGYDFAKSFRSSGSCEVNVNCPDGDNWQDEKRGVCMLVVGGSGFCTGSLINNSNNDGTPYVLTANHCSTSNDFSSWVFWFNWEAPTCTNPAFSPAHNNISGSVLKSRNAGSDFCLVQMNSVPPPNYNVFYNGWSRSTSASSSATCIHHPMGDIKKISHSSAISFVTYSGVSSWKTTWSGAVTEPGSSGSPLFNSEGLIVGQLYGGPSYCGASSIDMHDYYGRFDISWTGGNSSSTRLKDWLDPSDIDPLKIDGFYPNSEPFMTITPDYFEVTENLGNITINVNANVSWTVTCDQTWCALSTESGSGSTIVNVRYTANSSDARVADITFTGSGVESKVVKINQSAGVPLLGVNPDNYDVTFNAGSENFTVSSIIDWTASSDQSWCVLSETSGTANATISANYEANTGVARTANITFSGSGVTDIVVAISQPFYDPELIVTPTFYKVDFEAGHQNLTVTSNTSWTAYSDQTWCKIAPVSGNGNAIFSLDYEQNIGISRTAVITFGCINLENITVILNQNSNILKENEFFVYPNPSDGIFNIESSLETVNYNIYDVTGRMIYSGTINNLVQINLSDYPKGLYLLKVDNETNMFSKIIIK
jgi:V8-like Glu-specific endopeptidase